MDISDFLFVRQWKVEHLSMCSFGQRLGRAARVLSLRATFVLFAESKYFDYRRQTIPQKRAADTPDGPIQHPCIPNQSREAPVRHSIATPRLEGSGSQARVTIERTRSRSVDEVKAERNAVYAEFFRSRQVLMAQAKSSNSKSKPVNELEPAIEDIINAEERDLNCRRIPGDITFENSKLRT